MPLRLSDLPPDVLEKASGDWSIQSPLEPLPGWFAEAPEAWLDLHNQYCALAAKGEARVVFLGDSITQGWGSEGSASWDRSFGPLPSVNFGIGGDRTQQILWRLDNGTLDGLDPALFVLKIGVNNIWALRHSAEEVAEGVSAVVAKLRALRPQANILHLGILPTGSDPDSPYLPMVREINALLAPRADGSSVVFRDFGGPFLAPCGAVSLDLMPDGCHLSPEGYALFESLLRPEVEALLSDG